MYGYKYLYDSSGETVKHIFGSVQVYTKITSIQILTKIDLKTKEKVIFSDQDNY